MSYYHRSPSYNHPLEDHMSYQQNSIPNLSHHRRMMNQLNSIRERIRGSRMMNSMSPRHSKMIHHYSLHKMKNCLRKMDLPIHKIQCRNQRMRDNCPNKDQQHQKECPMMNPKSHKHSSHHHYYRKMKIRPMVRHIRGSQKMSRNYSIHSISYH
jgi:hypothetical protein